jgi:hypothetical protein
MPVLLFRMFVRLITPIVTNKQETIIVIRVERRSVPFFRIFGKPNTLTLTTTIKLRNSYRST